VELIIQLTWHGVDAGPHTIAWHLAEQHHLKRTELHIAAAFNG
jgi:hypothetical protein